MSLKLYNTFSRQVEAFEPINPGSVGIYCCGPTVYNFQHVGNLKTYVCEDVLVRALKLAGYQVKHVMNITDVGHLTSDADQGEDKMLVAMRREGKSSKDIARYYSGIFFEDCAKLNILKPDVICPATEYVADMIALVERIIANGYAYVAAGNVYFDVEKFSEYGRLAQLDLKSLKAGARIEVDRNKKNPLDFVLWFTNSKFTDQELQWDSPWGRGYPGWHIECSAMSIRHLGEQIDIHCGGIDHIPVHHTNEIAQSEAATGKHPWVRYWVHSEFLAMNQEKMSKSKGGFIVLNDLIGQGFDPLVFRIFILSGHYRKQLNFSQEALRGSERILERLKQAVIDLKEGGAVGRLSDLPEDHPLIAEFSEAIFNDLNTPQAMAVLWKVIGDKSLSNNDKLSVLYYMDQVIGLGMDQWEKKVTDIPEDVFKLVEERQRARAAKDWNMADKLRDQLAARGYVVTDSADGPKISTISR